MLAWNKNTCEKGRGRHGRAWKFNVLKPAEYVVLLNHWTELTKMSEKG